MFSSTIITDYLMGKNFINSILLCLLLVAAASPACVHDHFAAGATHHYYDDLAEAKQPKSKRLLQELISASATSTTSNQGKIRIYADYSFLKTGGATEKNLIKRALNISANYFYNTIRVTRLDRLRYPNDTSLNCNVLTVPAAYVTSGVVGDLGILVSNQVSATEYVAKSVACALLKSNNRPIWGVMIWNNQFLEYDQVGFQKIVFVAIHELTHILGFSAAMYSLYPAGNPYRNTNNTQYLTSPTIINEIKTHFGCNSPLGIILEDQDGTLIPSHNERKVFGNQYMIASAKKGSYVSRTTLALLASTGWYNVSYDYAEPTTWGKGKGCGFLDIDNCVSDQFCNNNQFGCDWDQTAMGRCANDAFAGSCKLTNYFVNTVCIDENYELKNLNANLEANQRGGANSRCFSSNFRKTGLTASPLNNRCYVTVCSATSNFLFILVGNYVLFCSSANLGQQIPAPLGMQGTLRCPSSFNNHCQIKKTCPFHCNKNGACINGLCLCTGSTILTVACLDAALTINQVSDTAGLINSIVVSRGDVLVLSNSKVTNSQKIQESLESIQRITKSINEDKRYVVSTDTQTINSRCFEGTFFDPFFGECTRCSQRFGCDLCTVGGCLSCPQGSSNVQGKCLSARKI